MILCSHADSRVLDSRKTPQGIRRRRECLHCGARWFTLEKQVSEVTEKKINKKSFDFC